MELKKFSVGPFQTNVYILKLENSCILIDAPFGTFELMKSFLSSNKLDISHLILTHGHWDHTADAGAIKNEFNANILIHQNDLKYITDKSEHKKMYLPDEIANQFIETTADLEIDQDNIQLEIDGVNLNIIHTPGHTQGSISIHIPENKIVFCGDTLFKSSIGRTDLSGGDSFQIIESIQTKLFTLPFDTIVYPGHGPETNIKFEIDTNPFLK